MKKLPNEAIEDLTFSERIIAHFEDNYEVLEEDQVRFNQVNVAFKVIHGSDNDEYARRKLKVLFPELDTQKLTRIINDSVEIYGDFFVVNSNAMRVIQEKRHERVYESAMRHGDHAAAERALGAIDKLHRLYMSTAVSAPSTRLPKTRRTSDPQALQKLKDAQKGS